MRLLRMTRLKRRLDSLALYRVGEALLYRNKRYRVLDRWFDGVEWRYLLDFPNDLPLAVPESRVKRRRLK